MEEKELSLEKRKLELSNKIQRFDLDIENFNSDKVKFELEKEESRSNKKKSKKYYAQKESELKMSIASFEKEKNKIVSQLKKEKDEITKGIYKMSIFNTAFTGLQMEKSKLKGIHDEYTKICKMVNTLKIVKSALENECEELNKEIENSNETINKISKDNLKSSKLEELDIIKALIEKSRHFKNFKRDTVVSFLGDISKYIRKNNEIIDSIKSKKYFKDFVGKSECYFPNILKKLVTNFEKHDEKIQSIQKELDSLRVKSSLESKNFKSENSKLKCEL